MRELLISRRADSDLVGIAEFTTREFGVAQARRYRVQLAACFASLQDNPMLGASADDLAPGLRRLRQQAHVIFYLPSEEAVLIVRVLHHSMDFLPDICDPACGLTPVFSGHDPQNHL